MGKYVLRIIRYLTFGAILTFVPLIISTISLYVTGYIIEKIDVLPDLLLLVFAISSNALGNECDIEKKVNSTYKIIAGIISGLSGFFCFSIYVSLFNAINTQAEKDYIQGGVEILFWICIVLAILNVGICISMEVIDLWKTNKDASNVAVG